MFIYFGIYGIHTSMGTRPMTQTPVRRVSYAGPTTCLRCDQEFRSWDRRHNRLCPRCRQLLNAQPSDEVTHTALTRRRLTPHDSAAAG
jgi:hypothetical protein